MFYEDSIGELDSLFRASFFKRLHHEILYCESTSFSSLFQKSARYRGRGWYVTRILFLLNLVIIIDRHLLFVFAVIFRYASSQLWHQLRFYVELDQSQLGWFYRNSDSIEFIYIIINLIIFSTYFFLRLTPSSASH